MRNLRAGRQGIEPCLRGLEARPVTMTLRPSLVGRCGPLTASRRASPAHAPPAVPRATNECCWQTVLPRARSGPAPRTGIEPVSSNRQSDCDASRITRQNTVSPAGLEPASNDLGNRCLSTRPRGRATGRGEAHRGAVRGPARVPLAQGVVRGLHPPPLGHSQSSSLDE